MAFFLSSKARFKCNSLYLIIIFCDGVLAAAFFQGLSALHKLHLIAKF